MNRIWPSKLLTPHVKLGVPVEEGIDVLSKIGTITHEQDDQGRNGYRVELEQYRMEIYERAGRVVSVWYDDPAGRSNWLGKRKKIALYLDRHREKGSWDLRVKNGWNNLYFNDADHLVMAYGVHMDVMKFQLALSGNADNQPVAPLSWGPEKITAEIRADNVYSKIGKYLHLEQKLQPGEHSWMTMKIEIPDSWIVADLSFQGEGLVLNVKDKGTFQISASNQAALSNAVLIAGEGKKVDDQKLEVIWNEYAKDPNG